MNNMLTLPEAVKRLAKDGMAVSQYTLKIWLDNGMIPCKKIGRKRLIYYPNIIEFLTSGNEPTPPAQETRAPGIRRIEID